MGKERTARNMKLNAANTLASLLLLTVLLAGCATNPVAESYRAHPGEGDLAGVETPFEPYAGKTKLQGSTNLEGDGMNLKRDGYLIIGRFIYEGNAPITGAQIIAQGQKVQADMILYRTGRGMSRMAVPITDDAELPQAPHQTGMPNAGTLGDGTATFPTMSHQGDAVPNRAGTISTSMVPTVRLPVHEATFWRKRMTPSKP